MHALGHGWHVGAQGKARARHACVPMPATLPVTLSSFAFPTFHFYLLSPSKIIHNLIHTLIQSSLLVAPFSSPSSNLSTHHHHHVNKKHRP